jgi:hypothetical protein
MGDIKFHKFEMDINYKGFGTVKIDGKELNNVLGVKITTNVNEINIVDIKFVTGNIKLKINE